MHPDCTHTAPATVEDRRCEHCGTVTTQTFYRCFNVEGRIPRCTECLGNLNRIHNHI